MTNNNHLPNGRDPLELPPPLPLLLDRSPVDSVQVVLLADIDLQDRTFQYRLVTSISELQHSLALDGQAEPVDLLGEKPYRIIDGFQRLTALRAMGSPTVKAIIHTDMSEEAAHTMAFVKNVVRKNLSPLDKAYAIQKARQRGLSQGDLERIFNLSEKQLLRYTALLAFPPTIQRLVDQGAISMTHAKHLADYGVTDVIGWATRCREQRLSARQLKKALEAAIGKPRRSNNKVYVRMDHQVLRLYPFQVSRSAAPAEKEKVVKLLREAIVFLEQGP